MSTKNLSRTIIEGGRYNGNTWDRRESHAEARFDEKMYLKEVSQDLENWYDYDIEPLRVVGQGFSDKLSPIFRWLRAQTGRLWDDVYSEINEKFDTRTTAGRHIVHDHLIKSVEVVPNYDFGAYKYAPADPTTSFHKNEFYVDENGFLQEKRKIPRKTYKRPVYDTKQLANWLSGRIVGKVGKKLFWYIPADKNKKNNGYSRTWKISWGARRYYYNDGPVFIYLAERDVYQTNHLGQRIIGEDGRGIIIGKENYWVDAYPPSFRQGNKLSTKEVVYFNNLPEYYQKKILDCSPTNPTPVKPDYRRYW